MYFGCQLNSVKANQVIPKTLICFRFCTEVDVIYGDCSCVDGSSKKLCKHQQWVISKYSLETLKVLTKNSKLRVILFKIACGIDPPPGFLDNPFEQRTTFSPDNVGRLVN